MLAGKRCLVTGGSRGLGLEFCLAFARNGARVAFTYSKDDDAAAEARAKIAAAGAEPLVFKGSVADGAHARKTVDDLAARWGGIDVLVNNAGANKRGAIEKYSADELAGVVQVNLVAPIMLTRLVLPYLRKRGRGAVVNVASIAGRIPVGHEAVYSATKFGLRAFTFALVEELEGSNITVSAVSPGPVDTGFIMENLDEVPNLVFAQPMSTAEDIAKAILDCAADGTLERTIPQLTGYLATAGYLLPALRKLMFPLMERQGAAAKEVYRKRHAGGA
jgi:NAD(P)-dependent dehydrogenase (short-subunit alcohol dehydrogenase family)